MAKGSKDFIQSLIHYLLETHYFARACFNRNILCIMWITYISPKLHEDYIPVVTERQSISYITVRGNDKCYDESLGV